MDALHIEASTHEPVDDLVDAVLFELESRSRVTVSFLNAPRWSARAMWELATTFPCKRICLVMFNYDMIRAVREALAMATEEIKSDERLTPSERRRYVYCRVQELLCDQERSEQDSRTLSLEGRSYRRGLWLLGSNPAN